MMTKNTLFHLLRFSFQRKKASKRRRALYLMMLTAIIAANILFFVLPQHSQAAQIRSTHTSSTKIPLPPPLLCGVTESPSDGCLDANSLDCINGQCFSCGTQFCQPVPVTENDTVQQSLRLPLWKNNTLFVYTPLCLTVYLQTCASYAGPPDKGTVNPDGTSNKSITAEIWGWSLGVLDILSIIAITLVGIRMMFSGEAATMFSRAEAALVVPNVILALASAHMSMIIIIIFLSLNNALSLDLYNWVGSNIKQDVQCDLVTVDKATSNQWISPSNSQYMSAFANLGGTAMVRGALLSGNIATAKWVIQGDPASPYPFDPAAYASWQKFMSGGMGYLPVTQNGKEAYVEVEAGFNCKVSGFGNADLLSAFEDIEGSSSGFWNTLTTSFEKMWDSTTDFTKTLFGMSILALLGQMVGRFITINFFIITAPLGLGAWALPGRMGQGLTSSWFKGFISSVMMQTLQVAALIIAEFSVTQIYNAIMVQGVHGTNGDNDPLVTVQFIIGTAMVWFIIRIPSLLGNSATNMIMEMGQQGSRAMGAFTQHAMSETQSIIGPATTILAGLGIAFMG